MESKAGTKKALLLIKRSGAFGGGWVSFGFVIGMRSGLTGPEAMGVVWAYRRGNEAAAAGQQRCSTICMRNDVQP